MASKLVLLMFVVAQSFPVGLSPLRARPRSRGFLVRAEPPEQEPQFRFVDEPQERDLVIPALTVLSIAALFGTYAAATLKLMAEGQFYMPHL